VGRTLSVHHDFRTKRNLSLKRYLINLNKKLDYAKYAIKTDYEYGFHSSLPAFEGQLSEIELCALVLEDRFFFSHHGIELRAIPRVIKRYLRTGQIGGISTIEQQTIRTIMNRRERTLARKFHELILAYCLNFHCAKRMILRYYLNNAYFGYALRGCDEASVHIFGKQASALDHKQAAFIASLLARPLPRAIFITLEQRLSPPVDPHEIIYDAKRIGLRWAENVERRYNYALALQASNPISRLIK
jgi:hypothetical protein